MRRWWGRWVAAVASTALALPLAGCGEAAVETAVRVGLGTIFVPLNEFLLGMLSA